MGKQLMIEDSTYAKLQKLKKGEMDSFTKVIEWLLGRKHTPRQRLLVAIRDFEAVAEDTIEHNSLDPILSMLRITMLEVQSNPESVDDVTEGLQQIVDKALKGRKKK